MKQNAIRALLVATFLVCGAMSGKAQGHDIQGSKDHPLITRYPGSVIGAYAHKEYDEFTFPLGPLKDDGSFAKSQHLEGKWTRIEYEAPEGRSLLEVYRNYEGALQRAGFQSLFVCASQDCGRKQLVRLSPSAEDNWSWGDLIYRHLSAKLARSTGDVYVSLHAMGSNSVRITLHIVEVKPMEAGLVTVDAASMEKDITSLGHVSVYGIYFDTGKADLKPESDAALAEIAKLLKQDANLKLYVVGHTDNVGTLASNMDLSKRRGEAVVGVLTTKNSIATARLSAQGDGPTAPVASNDSEEGRAKNRRVELVKQ